METSSIPMAPSRMKTLGALTVALVAGLVAYFITFDKPLTSQPPLARSAEIIRADTGANPRDQSILLTRRASEPTSQPQPIPDDDQRIAAIKGTISNVLEANSQAWADELSQEGLAQSDSELAVHRFVEGVTDCIFDAARREYEIQGMGLNEFLEAAEAGSWFRTWEYLMSKRVRRAAASCIANISQQTGRPMFPNFESGGPDVDRIQPAPSVPPWATGMDSRIRDHVASYPDAGVTNVQVQCVEAGCQVALIGHASRVFDLEFDVFAEQNGFAHAVVGNSIGNTRIVWLQHTSSSGVD